MKESTVCNKEMVNCLKGTNILRIFIAVDGPSGRLPSEIVGLNSTGGMDMSVVSVVCCQVEVSATS